MKFVDILTVFILVTNIKRKLEENPQILQKLKQRKAENTENTSDLRNSNEIVKQLITKKSMHFVNSYE